MEKINLKDLTYEELLSAIQELGEPKFRAEQIFKWLYKGAVSFDDMKNIPKTLKEKLMTDYCISKAEIAERLISNIDGTRKYLLRLSDGNYIETVLMKYKHGYTICVSSQVGCAMGCAFCASTRNGKIRNLSAGEIIDQIITVQDDIGERISNIVMMGIGEPLDNFDNVLKFLKNVNDERGLGIGHRHITVSTCGLVHNIIRLADMKLQITLSISLHATNDKTRSEIMPVNRRYNIEELLDACDYYIKQTNRRISFEYTLISGVNDNRAEAVSLGRLLKNKLCHVNLIPVNSVKETGFVKSGREKIEEFQKTVESFGISATIRREMGSDINAACGQLRNKHINEG